MIREHLLQAACLLILSASLITPAQAGIVVHEEGDRYLEIGGRIQIQYVHLDTEGGRSTDQILIRRLRPYITASVTRNWLGKIEFDFGRSLDAEEVSIKDAYMMYSGWNNHAFYIGNTKTTFSREFLTSSKRQQLVERSFVGDHNFGAPDRQLGFRLDGHTQGEMLAYKFSLGAEHHDPDARRIDFDTPADTASDWNEGLVYAGRLDLMPMGSMQYDQGDFRTDQLRIGLGLAAFGWSNDDDVNVYTDEDGNSLSTSNADLDSAVGFELSFSIRGRGISADVDYNVIDADTVDRRFTGGIYRVGGTELEHLALEGGYMLPNRLEIVGGWDSQNADNYQTSWDRTSLGVNYFLDGHDLKVQFTYRMGQNIDGIDGNDLASAFLQFQFVF